MLTDAPRVALALGSGGARGYAHIGVLQVLAEHGFEVVTIAGTSMGALIGGLYAAGRLEAFTDWAVTLGQRDVWRMLDPSLQFGGAIKAERIMARVSALTEGVLIEDLGIPFTAIATELEHRHEIWFQRGPLDVAIRASIAIPGLITPIVVNRRLLVDGGVLNPVPIEPTAGVDSDLTIAVSLSGRPRPAEHRTPVKTTSEPNHPPEWVERMRAGMMENPVIRSLALRLGADEEDRPFEQPSPDLRIVDLTASALEAMGSLITRYRMAAYPPDVLIEIGEDACRMTDFHRATELIELGRSAAERGLAGYLP